jgi:uncharacterized protein YggE
MHKSIFALTFLTISKLAAAEPELKGSPAELAAYLGNLPKMVSIAGESEVKMPADRAVVSLKVSTEQKLLQDTLRANQEARAKIISMLKDRGIPSERVQASKFSSTIVTGIFGGKAKSYRVENVLKVKVQDEKEFQSVAHVVDVMPEVQFHGVDFEQTDKESIKSKALEQAIDNASARKRIFEDKLGVKLTPKSFAQIGAVPQSGRPYVTGTYYSEAAAVQGGSAAKRVTALPSPGYAVVEEESGSLFGEMTFTARVLVDYAVEAK